MRLTKLITFVFVIIPLNCLFSQDIIILKNGDEIKSRVLEITVNEIKYKKFENLDGPSISILKNEVFMIKYQNGTKDVINSGNMETAAKPYGPLEYENMGLGLYFNPLGFLQFGPILGVEIPSGNNLVIDAHLRIHSLGLLSYILADDNNGVSPDKLSAIAIGGGLKYTRYGSKGGLYVGPLLEYGWNKQSYHVGNSNEYEERVKYLVFVTNLGYKFRFSSGFYVNCGVYLGAYYTFQDQWQYKYNPIVNEGNSKGLALLGMLELGVGLEF